MSSFLKVFSVLLFGLVANHGFAQSADKSSQVYDAYFAEGVFGYDSVYRKHVKTAIISPLFFDKERLTLLYDADYLRDYLTGRLCDNPRFAEFVERRGWDTLFCLSYPFGLAAAVRKSKETGWMLLKLDSITNDRQPVPAYFKEYNRYIKVPDSKQVIALVIAQGWKAFYKQHPRCFGLMEVSAVVFSGDGNRATFFEQYHRDGFDGGGSIVFMKRTVEGWEWDFALRIWVS